MGPESTFRWGGCSATRCGGVVPVVAVVLSGEGHALTRLGGNVVSVDLILDAYGLFSHDKLTA